MGFRSVLKQWYVKYTKLRWTVGIAEFDPTIIFDPRKKLRIHWVKHNNKDSWFADPFILSISDDHISLLVEEFIYSYNRGRISRLTVNRHNWNLEKIEPLIEQKTHLSFPAYYREREKVFIYPENTQTGKLTLFEYDENTGELVKVKDISSHPLADAVLYKLNGQKVIMATTSPDDSGRSLDFYPFDGEPDSSPVETVRFDTKVARNAGIPFKAQGRVFRPAQDCTQYYGSCVVIQEMVEENGKVSFKEIRRFHSPLLKYGHAFHTFNVFEDSFIAVDAEGFRHGPIAKALFYIREHFRK